MFLRSILNNPNLDLGLWGARHIHKKPLELPILSFVPTNIIHKKLAEKGKLAHTKGALLLEGLVTKMNIETDTITPNLVGRLRGTIRNSLSKEISEIDDLVIDLLALKK